MAAADSIGAVWQPLGSLSADAINKPLGGTGSKSRTILNEGDNVGIASCSCVGIEFQVQSKARDQ